MEMYTIDPANSNRPGILVEGYESFIWTDRYSDFGDFTLVTSPTPDVLARLLPGKLFGFDQSNRLMVIDSTLRKQDDDGKSTLEVKGRSLERIFEDRVAMPDLNSSDWVRTGTAGSIVTNMVKALCIDGAGISPSEVIPHLTVSNLSGTSTSMTISIKAGTLYERIKNICDTYDLGFRLTYTRGNPTLAFVVYAGVDRTASWGIEFSTDLDNLSDTSYYRTREAYKNVAYVIYKSTGQIVLPSGPEPTGLNRRIILVDASDVSITTDLTTALIQRGKDALSQSKEKLLFDGTINPNFTYKYGTDYDLGDLVPVVGDDGSRTIMRVTEYIWSYNSEGFSSYPTFANVGEVGDPVDES